MSPVIPRRRCHPVFFTLLGGLSLGLIAVGWAGYRVRTELQAAQRSLAMKQQEWQAMGQVSIPANENVAARAELRFASEQAVAGLQNQLRLDSKAATQLRAVKLPTERTEAFFDLALLVDQLREQAAQHGVAIRPDERFGFATYANGGPDTALIPVVYRQRQLIRYLVEQLFAVQPTELLALQRERPGMAMRERPEAGAAMQDFFTIDPRISVRALGRVNSLALRVSFTGLTPVLRAFLNRLAGSELPLMVRAVEVEPLVVSGGGDKPRFVVDATAQPYIRREPSKFTVTLEYIDVPSAGEPET